MPVTPHDRRHFDLIARQMAAEKDEQRREALDSTPAERVALGFQLGAVPRTPAIEAALDERAKGQIGLAKRAREMRQ